jgi:hypothetical protein
MVSYNTHEVERTPHAAERAPISDLFTQAHANVTNAAAPGGDKSSLSAANQAMVRNGTLPPLDIQGSPVGNKDGHENRLYAGHRHLEKSASASHKPAPVDICEPAATAPRPGNIHAAANAKPGPGEGNFSASLSIAERQALAAQTARASALALAGKHIGSLPYDSKPKVPNPVADAGRVFDQHPIQAPSLGSILVEQINIALGNSTYSRSSIVEFQLGVTRRSLGLK